MLDYTAKAGDTFAKLARYFFENELHAPSLSQFNSTIDHSREIVAGTKLAIPAKLISPIKNKRGKGNIIFYIKAGFRNCLTDTVGANGTNHYEDVMLVQKKLKDLGYPIKDTVGICSTDTIQAIKLFKRITRVHPQNSVTIDGLIDKDGNTGNDLFKKNNKKYFSNKKFKINCLMELKSVFHEIGYCIIRSF